MKITFLTLAAFSLLFFNSCENSMLCEKGEGEVLSKQLNLPPISGIQVSNSSNVQLTYSADGQLVTVRGQENIIDNLSLEVEDGIWNIDYDSCVRTNKEMVISISLPLVEYIGISGSGNVESTNHFPNQKDFEIDINGSGDLNLDMDVTGATIDIRGSGNVELAGKANSATYDIDGSGDVAAYGFETGKVKVDIDGSGSVEVKAVESLAVDIDGSGDVYYKGKPDLTVDISGSGEVHNSN